MDRNLLWDRTEKAFSNLTDPNIKVTNISPKDYLIESYKKNVTDEFLEPVRITKSFLNLFYIKNLL